MHTYVYAHCTYTYIVHTYVGTVSKVLSGPNQKFGPLNSICRQDRRKGLENGKLYCTVKDLFSEDEKKI